MTELVTYHYVRPRTPARFPGLHVRSVAEFDHQLDLLADSYCATLRSVVDRIESGEAANGTASARSPERSYCLTFDDGFLDHYLAVYPRLRDRGLTGAFFPIAGASLHGQLLDVHKIQLTLATGSDINTLRGLAATFLTAEGCGDLVASLEPDPSTRATGGRFDLAEVKSLKRALQVDLPTPIRSATVDHLFRRIVGEDPDVVAAELYADVEHLREMARSGMEIGGHSVRHHHLDTMTDAELEAELAGSIELLTAVHGRQGDDWVFCYPYGSYDDRVAEATKAAGFRAGLAVTEGAATPDVDLMAIPRFDTNAIERLEAAGATTAEMAS